MTTIWFEIALLNGAATECWQNDTGGLGEV